MQTTLTTAERLLQAIAADVERIGERGDLAGDYLAELKLVIAGYFARDSKAP